jgi:hypothetical protein
MLWQLVLTSVKLLLFLSIPIGIFIYFALFGLSHIYDVELGESEIRFVMFKRFSIWHLPIEAIKRVYDRNSFMTTHGLLISMFFVFPAAVNRFPRNPNPIIVERKTGFPRYLSLTPENPGEFLQTLSRYLEAFDQ